MTVAPCLPPWIGIDQALAHYAERLRPLGVDTVPVTSALGRVLAEPPRAALDLPPFTQSGVDGYALRAADVGRATPETPVTLRLVGEVAAGSAALPPVEPGTAVRIFTGGALPPGADTVARQEIVTRDGDTLALRQPLAPGTDTRFQGEELAEGTPLGQPGQRLTPGAVAALATAGVAAVSVQRRPRLAVLITGDEVVPVGQPRPPGAIFDANGPLIAAWCAARGLPAPALLSVPDRPERLRAALGEALEEADLVLTTGGVSVGEHDHVRAEAAALGVEQVFWRVAQKPGMPLYFGVRGHKAVLGLPGNPGAVLVGLEAHAARVLAHLEGEQPPAPHWQRAPLAEAFTADHKREGLVRMRLLHDDAGQARLWPLGRQASHMLSNLFEATVLVRVPPGPQPAGTRLAWCPLTRVGG